MSWRNMFEQQLNFLFVQEKGMKRRKIVVLSVQSCLFANLYYVLLDKSHAAMHTCIFGPSVEKILADISCICQFCGVGFANVLTYCNTSFLVCFCDRPQWILEHLIIQVLNTFPTSVLKIYHNKYLDWNSVILHFPDFSCPLHSAERSRWI